MLAVCCGMRFKLLIKVRLPVSKTEHFPTLPQLYLAAAE
jgi:hypothetical protein